MNDAVIWSSRRKSSNGLIGISQSGTLDGDIDRRYMAALQFRLKVEPGRVEGKDCAARLGDLTLFGNGLDRDDMRRPGLEGQLDHEQPDSACLDHEYGGASLDPAKVDAVQAA